MTQWTSSDGTLRILIGNCLVRLKDLPNESVHCCVTSPPYWGLRDYGTATWEGGSPECDHIDADKLAERKRQQKSMIACGERIDGSTRTRVHDEEAGKCWQYRETCGKCGARRIDDQIGLERTPEEYVAKMVEVFREVRRVLRNDGCCFVNLGDTYAGGGRGGNPDESPFRKQATNTGSVTGRAKDPNIIPSGIKPKDLVGIPWRVAFALQADGWWLRQDIIWSKPNPMPESVTDRCTKSHEYIFLLTKAARYFYDAEAVKERGSWDRVNDPDWSKQRAITNEKKGCGNRNGKSTGFADWQPEQGRNRRSVWTVATQPYKEAHFATFPPALIEPMVLAGCPEQCCPKCGLGWERIIEKGTPPPEPNNRNPQKRLEPHQAGNVGEGNMGFRASKLSGQEMTAWKAEHPDRTIGWSPACDCGESSSVPGVVLDPFGGSGTTGEVALKLGRNAILIELNGDYVEMAKLRAGRETPSERFPLFEKSRPKIPELLLTQPLRDS